MRWLVALLFACSSSGGGGPSNATHDTPSGANACYLAGNSGTGAANDTDCCFGFQCESGACCRGGGAVCNTGGECCSGTCTSGQCACGAIGAACSSDYGCCTGTSCVVSTMSRTVMPS